MIAKGQRTFSSMMRMMVIRSESQAAQHSGWQPQTHHNCLPGLFPSHEACPAGALPPASSNPSHPAGGVGRVRADQERCGARAPRSRAPLPCNKPTYELSSEATRPRKEGQGGTKEKEGQGGTRAGHGRKRWTKAEKCWTRRDTAGSSGTRGDTAGQGGTNVEKSGSFGKAVHQIARRGKGGQGGTRQVMADQGGERREKAGQGGTRWIKMGHGEKNCEKAGQGRKRPCLAVFVGPTELLDFVRNLRTARILV